MALTRVLTDEDILRLATIRYHLTQPEKQSAKIRSFDDALTRWQIKSKIFGNPQFLSSRLILTSTSPALDAALTTITSKLEPRMSAFRKTELLGKFQTYLQTPLKRSEYMIEELTTPTRGHLLASPPEIRRTKSGTSVELRLLDGIVETDDEGAPAFKSASLRDRSSTAKTPPPKKRDRDMGAMGPLDSTISLSPDIKGAITTPPRRNNRGARTPLLYDDYYMSRRHTPPPHAVATQTRRESEADPTTTRGTSDRYNKILDNPESRSHIPNAASQGLARWCLSCFSCFSKKPENTTPTRDIN